jgi:hypothetical protein
MPINADEVEIFAPNVAGLNAETILAGMVVSFDVGFPTVFRLPRPDAILASRPTPCQSAPASRFLVRRVREQKTHALVKHRQESAWMVA